MDYLRFGSTHQFHSHKLRFPQFKIEFSPFCSSSQKVRDFRRTGISLMTASNIHISEFAHVLHKWCYLWHTDGLFLSLIVSLWEVPYGQNAEISP
jgi:hypothetical protein